MKKSTKHIQYISGDRPAKAADGCSSKASSAGVQKCEKKAGKAG